jgi:hypothetical protein
MFVQLHETKDERNSGKYGSISDNSDFSIVFRKSPCKKACDFVPISNRNCFSSFASSFKLHTMKWWQGKKSIYVTALHVHYHAIFLDSIVTKNVRVPNIIFSIYRIGRERFAMPASYWSRDGGSCPRDQPGTGRTSWMPGKCLFLLVRRWRKLPKGSARNWLHVVDAR